jgi:hypothetical protein
MCVVSLMQKKSPCETHCTEREKTKFLLRFSIITVKLQQKEVGGGGGIRQQVRHVGQHHTCNNHADKPYEGKFWMRPTLFLQSSYLDPK